MIIKKYDEQISEFYDNRAIIAVYKGARLIWAIIKSCFGKGYWINEQPWMNNDAWIN